VPNVQVVADRDDDDADGVPDGEQAFLPPAARADLVALDRSLIGASIRPMTGAAYARVVADGRPLPWGKALPEGAHLQGVRAGTVNAIAIRGGVQSPLLITVEGVGMRDGEGHMVDLARSHASLERTPPARVEGGPDSRDDDPDALKLLLEEPEGEAPRGILSVESVGAAGAKMDVITRPQLANASCPVPASGMRCSASPPLRFVADEVDRRHALVEWRSLRAEVGGAIVVRRDGKKLQAVRVLGPRASPAGPIARLRATIRPFVLRVTPGGAPAIGGNDAGAVTALRAELALASAIWGQCGLTFGKPEALDVKIVDPPVSHLVAIGDDLGIPASGGELRLRMDGRVVTLPIARGATPDRVAIDLAHAIEAVGLAPIISPNARIAPGSSGSVDVSVRKKDGSLVAVDTVGAGAPLTNDATLSVRIGSVDLSDGLQHFGDMDSMAGTLEERTLLKAVDDGDPATLEVVVVPFFAGGGRIGESFIGSDLSSVRNVVLLDRAGIRARKSSLTLAHELGHVLLDMPGHPDDYGVDTPTLLMDSDASDASPFGPRRLTVDECARVVREAGPRARMPLLVDWPLSPLNYSR
jgi:hypothetical protein